MTSAVKINENAEMDLDLQTIANDVTALKRDLAALLGAMKTEASAGATSARSAVGQFGEDALRAYENLAAKGERSVKAIGRQVEEQPVISLFLAFAAGFLGSRLLSR